MATSTICEQSFINTIVHGDCIEVMRQMPAQSVDFILTDPPYLVNFRDRSGRSIANDCDNSWLKPAFAEAGRVLKQNHLMVCFYGWSKVDRFFAAWRAAGFRPVGHIVFTHGYASNTRKDCYVRYQHEQAYLMAKGRPEIPRERLADVQEFQYSLNKLHPTQKPVPALMTLIKSFTRKGENVLDPFCGSGSTCAAAALARRKYIGIEVDAKYQQIAVGRMGRVSKKMATQPLAYS